MTADEETHHFRQVFGIEGSRTKSQKHVMALIKTEVFKKSFVEKKNPKSARDFWIPIYLKLIKGENEQ